MSELGYHIGSGNMSLVNWCVENEAHWKQTRDESVLNNFLWYQIGLSKYPTNAGYTLMILNSCELTDHDFWTMTFSYELYNVP